MLPWFADGRFPLYLAPMAGVTDSVFRRICRAQGADVLVTEFVSADGIRHRNQRTREMVSFDASERPVGVQLFGADPDLLGEAARQVVDWVQPDFIDLNFGCPVNKVVSKHGGSALLRDCPLLEKVARGVVKAVPDLPVTGKIRIGWSSDQVNAVTTARILENAGVQVVAVHGRTKDQGYSGEADWDVIGQVADALTIPVIGNGDLTSADDVLRRKRETAVSGVMIGRAAMTAPWLFGQVRQALQGRPVMPEPGAADRWKLILDHCRQHVDASDAPESIRMHSMRARLMAYTKGMVGGRQLRMRLQKVESVRDVEEIAAQHLQLLDEGLDTSDVQALEASQ